VCGLITGFDMTIGRLLCEISVVQPTPRGSTNTRSSTDAGQNGQSHHRRPRPPPLASRRHHRLGVLPNLFGSLEVFFVNGVVLVLAVLDRVLAADLGPRLV